MNREPHGKPLRCLFVSTARHPGGAERSLSLLVRHLAAAGTVCAVARAGAVREIDDGVVARYHLVAFEPVRRPGIAGCLMLLLRWAWCVVVLCAVASTFRPNVVHANATPAMLVSLLPAAMFRRPLIWHVRDLVSLGGWGRVLGRRAAAVIAVSRAVRESLARSGIPERKVRVIANGVDQSWVNDDGARQFARADLRTRLGFPGQSFVFLSVGQYVDWKRHDLFIVASARVARVFPHARFVVIGGRPAGGGPGCKGALAETVEQAGLGRRVKLLDWQEDLRPWLAGADVLVHAAGAEPFGRAIIEAMACGLPVICARAAGPLDIVEHNRSGWFFEPGNAEALAAAMLQLITDGDLAGQLARAGRERLFSRFTADATARQVLGVYRDVLGAAGVTAGAESGEAI